MHFVNKTITATVKVCKYLTTGSDALAGETFYFTVNDGGRRRSVDHRGRGHHGACKIIGGRAPVPHRALSLLLGRHHGHRDRGSLGLPVRLGRRQPARHRRRQTVTVVGGINNVSFHNQALGQIEICKAMLVNNSRASTTATSTTSRSSTSRSTAPPRARTRTSRSRRVTARCRSSSTPVRTRSRRTLPRPTSGKTVSFGFAFVSSTATGPTGDNRATSGNANNGGNPITVNAPYFSDPVNGGETLVTFTNRVLRAQIKVCKVVEPGSLTPLGNDVWNVSARRHRARQRHAEPDGVERDVHRPDHAGTSSGGRLADHRRPPATRSLRPSPSRSPPAAELGDLRRHGRQHVPGATYQRHTP